MTISSPVRKTVSEMNADHERWRDEQKTVTRCAFCRWKVTGPAGWGREQATAHRAEKHPDLEPRSRADVEREARKDKERRKETLSQMAPPKTNAAKATPGGSPGGRSLNGRRWTRESALAALATWAKAHGRPPTSGEANRDPDLPSATTAQSLFGSWANYVEGGGFPRPTRGRRVQRPSAAPATPRDLDAEPKPEAAEEAAGADTRPVPEGITQFLYVLLRDHLPAGEVERILADHVEKARGKQVRYSNRYLKGYADALAARLLQSAA